MMAVAERITQLGGEPSFDPKGLDMHDLLVAHEGRPSLRR